MYAKTAGGEQPGAGPGPGAGPQAGQGGKKDDDVVDADFEEVK
jgi:molecular chaperone DnaK